MASQVVECTVVRCVYNEHGHRCALKDLVIGGGRLAPEPPAGSAANPWAAYCQSFLAK